MIQGLMVIRGDGILLYSYLRESISLDRQILISGFLAALQMFAKEMSSGSSSEMRSATIATTVYTFRSLTLHGVAGEPFDCHFVLLTDIGGKESSEVEDILELLIVSFLGHEYGGFLARLRISDTAGSMSFESFDEVMSELLKIGWDKAKKRIRPAPCSVMQGVLNELRDQLPMTEILSLHPKISRIGTSYVWLSDDTSVEEEEAISMAIQKELARLFGPGIYESIVKDVDRRFSSR